MDMLVKLYALPEAYSALDLAGQNGIKIRRAMASERDAVVQSVTHLFGNTAPGWASECGIAFTRVPIACFVAIDDGNPVGFSCYNCTFNGFFGPIGVAPHVGRQGVGSALLLTTLHALRMEGYAYAVIGHVGAPEFFRKTVGAIEIEGSSPGAYPDRQMRL